MPLRRSLAITECSEGTAWNKYYRSLQYCHRGQIVTLNLGAKDLLILSSVTYKILWT